MAYGDSLRSFLASRNISTRTLAKRLNPSNPESARRDLNRIFAGREPRAEKREEIAAALGVERREIEGDPDDEEEDPVAALLYQVQTLVRQAHQLHELGIAKAHKKRRVS